MLFGVLAGFLLGEGALRVTGFEHQVLPTLQFGWPRPEDIVSAYEVDRDLFWVPRGYPQLLARARLDRPAVVFLGDSCTQLGSYPARTLLRLRRLNPSLSRGVSFGVAGWSAVQGRVQLERDVLALRPQVATFYFGWNDHWTALGPPDKEARSGAVTWFLSQRSRFAQLVLKARLLASLKPAALRPNRVDLDTYRATLVEMGRLCDAAGVRVVFVTAPSNHQPDREPAYLAERHLRRLDELIPLHLAYVQATREAARQGGAVLCDAAERFAANQTERGRYFRSDGIHLTAEGDEAMAELLAACVVDALGSRARSLAPSPDEPRSR